MRTRILVVDDEEDSRVFLKSLLEAKGAQVATAGNVREAVFAAAESEPNLVLSDVCMPEEDGFSLCRRLKADARTAAIPVVLMSSARRQEQDQVRGIELGADDYLVKPYTPRLLLAKVQAVLRRFAFPAELDERLKAEGLSLDAQSRDVSLNGDCVHLTRKEFDLLTLLLRRRGHVFSVRYLLCAVWDCDPAERDDPHTVKVHVCSLRRKLGAKLGRRIETVSGLGYRFAA